LQPALGSPNGNAFVAKLTADGSALVYSTFLGGSGNSQGDGDAGNAIAVNAAGNAYVTGTTRSTDFPTANAFQSKLGGQGAGNAFVAELTMDGSALVYSTYLGGTGVDVGYGIAVDAAENAYITGDTKSPDFPTANAFQPVLGGKVATNAFVAELAADGSALVYSTYLGGSSLDGSRGSPWTRPATPTSRDIPIRRTSRPPTPCSQRFMGTRTPSWRRSSPKETCVCPCLLAPGRRNAAGVLAGRASRGTLPASASGPRE
jgi:hypothetical protein